VTYYRLTPIELFLAARATPDFVTADPAA